MGRISDQAGVRSRVLVNGVEYWKDGKTSQFYVLGTEDLLPGDTLIRALYRGREIRGLYLGMSQDATEASARAGVVLRVPEGEDVLLPGRVRVIHGGGDGDYCRLRLETEVTDFGIIGSKREVVRRKKDEAFLNDLPLDTP